MEGALEYWGAKYYNKNTERLLNLIKKERLSDDLRDWFKEELVWLDCNQSDIDLMIQSLKKAPIQNKPQSTILYLIGATEEKPTDRTNQTNPSFPDIDYDSNVRDEIIDFMISEWGEDRCALIGTYQSLQVKGAFKDVVRQLLNMPFEEANLLAKEFDVLNRVEFGGSEVEFFDACIEESKVLKKWFSEHENVKNSVRSLLGSIKSSGIHAAGIAVSSEEIGKIAPTVYNKDEEIGITQFNKDDLERVGLIKYDMLKLETLNYISKCISLVKERHGIDLDLEEIRLFDELVLEDIRQGNVETVFQLDTPTGKGLVTALKKLKSIGQIAYLTALGRPGPMNMKMHHEYIARHNGEKKVTYPHPKLEPILRDTLGIIVTQEQVMEALSTLAGFTGFENDKARKAMGKKQRDVLEKLKAKFVKGAKERSDIDDKDASHIWDLLESFAEYGFNKCVSGDTILYRDKNGSKPLTVEEMYLTMNDKEWAKKNKKKHTHDKYNKYGYGFSYSMSGDRVVKNNIVEIRYEGEKEVFEITTESGRKIKTTANHKFPTPNGKVRLDKLSVGDLLYVNLGYDKTQEKRRFDTGSNLPKKGQMGFQKKEYSAYNDWTNKSFIKREIANNCGICKNEFNGTKKEVHHIDGDHKNQKWSNLITVCPSCHKLEHYKMGRRKKGEKGFLLGTEKIKSIKKAGVKRVYDVEMGSPNNNFVVDSGIVTCNSHAVSYAHVAYYCAYLKYYFPLEWKCASLNYMSKEDFKRIYPKWQKDVAKPDVNLSGDGFVIADNKKVIMPLDAINGIGSKTSKVILENKPYKSMRDFIEKTRGGVKKSDVMNLIVSGAFDSMRPEGEPVYGYRNSLVEEYFNLRWEIMKTSKKEREKEAAEMHKYIINRKDEAMLAELNALNFTSYDISVFFKDRVQDLMNMLGGGKKLGYKYVTTEELQEYGEDQNKYKICVVGAYKELRVFKTKSGKNKGKEMAVITLSNNGIDSEITLFPDDYSNSKNFLGSLMEYEPIVVFGEINCWNGRTSIIQNRMGTLLKRD